MQRRGPFLRRILAPVVGGTLLLLIQPRPLSSAQPTSLVPPAETAKRAFVFGGDAEQTPYQYVDAQGEPAGFNVDLIRALVRAAGRRVEIRLTHGDVVEDLSAGVIDLAALSYTEARAGRLAFLDEVWTIRLSAFFLPGRESHPRDLRELGGETVAVREGSLTSQILLEIPEAIRPRRVNAADHEAGVALLRQGGATAVAGNDIAIRTEFARLGFKEVPELLLRANSYRLATARGREAEMAWVSEALKGLRASGEFSRILEKHLTEPQPQTSVREFAHLAGWGLAAVSLIVGLVLSWNRSLRTQVATRTARLSETVAEKDALARSLAEREQRMRFLVEQMPAILWSTDAHLTVTSASGLGIQTLGMADIPLVGARAEDLIDRFHLNESDVLERLRQSLKGEASDIEVQISGRDAEIHVEPLRDVGGRISGLVGMILDVTEKRRAARALRESEERYRAFVERSTEGIWRWEFNAPWPKSATLDEQMRHLLHHGYVAECNDAMARLYGLSHAAELVGLTFTEIRRLRQPLSDTDNTRAFVASGFQPARWETNWVDRNGVSRWSANSVMGIVEDGRLIRAWATQQDMTQQKAAEDGLRRALSLVRATLESTDDGILVENRDGGIVDVNHRFGEMWNVPPSMLVPGNRHVTKLGQHAADQLIDSTDFLERARRILEDPERESYDVLRLKDGRVLERYSRPQRLEEATVGRVWSFRDITERERALSEIKEANRLLEVKNAELERFTYTVSHDLKSPLITIRGYLGHLETSAAEGNLERFREDAARILRATAKMDDLLRDLLELSRVGRVVSAHADVSMAAVAQDAADLLRGPLRDRSVRLEISPDLPVVRADRQRLLEVMQNLMENAAKFMGDQKEPLIRVGMRRDGSEPVYFVADNGIGIEARHQEKVFELFEKLTPQTVGTGVGLALVRRIVEAHGGRTWVESPGAGLGSTFCFTLPAPS